jgi:uncharacterized protein (DUF362 family)
MSKVSKVWQWFWCILVRNRFAIAIASLIWLIWRSGSQPKRLAYPCQQAAAANLGALAVLFVPSLMRRRRARQGRRSAGLGELATGSIALAGMLFILVSAGVFVYSDAGDSFGPGSPATYSWNSADLSAATPLTSRVLEPTDGESVVAVNRNTSVTYGSQPYDPGTNSAYDLIWQTIVDLQLGTADNPLADWVIDSDGDGVIEAHIKPNHVQTTGDVNGNRSPGYTHPATFRPLVDMLAAAGATKITIGDACAVDNNYFTSVADPDGLTQTYVDQLELAANAMPGVTQNVTVDRIDLNDYSKFTWVDLGADSGESGISAYYGSGYDESHLAKANPGQADSNYFVQYDTQGQAGPGQSNCMGWLAIPNGLLDADVVIDLAKLKVHYYGVTTAILKNYVGATMLDTYNSGGWNGWCRVTHEPWGGGTVYQKNFGNDFLWRELVDAHRTILYYRDGVFSPSVTRRSLYVLDAINAAETNHFPEPPQPYWLHTVLAGVDPVAVDAVGARLQRYDFRHIPIINNAHYASIGSSRPLGTADPGKVRLVGDTLIDGTFNHVFDFDDRYDQNRSWSDWANTTIADLTPPTINTATASYQGGNWVIHANVSNGHVVYYYYGDDGTGAPNVVRLGKNGDTYSATVSGNAGSGTFVAQDEYFNTSTAEVLNTPAIGLNVAQIQRTVYFESTPADGSFDLYNSGAETLNYMISDDVDWLSVMPNSGDSTGPADIDTITVSYDTLGMNIGVYTASITVSDPGAMNSPQVIDVTLTIASVKPDLDDDGDVDQGDFGLLQACQTGNGTLASGDCVEADFTGDGYVDSADLSVFQACMSGAGIIPDETCDD